MAYSTGLYIVSAKQQKIIIPIWDAPALHPGVAGKFIANSIDAVIEGSAGALEFIGAGFKWTGEQLSDLTNNLTCSLPGPSGGTNVMGQGVAMGGQFFQPRTNIVAGSPDLLVTTAVQYFINPNSAKFALYSTQYGAGIPLNPNDAETTPVPMIYIAPNGKRIFGSSMRTVNTFPGGIFISPTYTFPLSKLPIADPTYAFFTPQLMNSIGLQNYMLSNYNNKDNLITMVSGSSPPNPPYTVVFDDPAFQVSPVRAYNTPFGYWLNGNAPATGPICILSPDGSRYWPIEYDPQSATAANLLTLINGQADIKIDGNLTFWLAQTNTPGGYIGTNINPVTGQPAYRGSPIILPNSNYPMRPISLPCSDYCVNPAISIGYRK